MYETQYQTLNGYMDSVAERLRVLGVKAPGSLDELCALSHMPQSSTDETADEMLANHCAAFVGLIEVLRASILIPSDVRDEGTVGVLSDILEWSEKECWMMSSAIK